jgi:CBS domain-containing protein
MIGKGRRVRIYVGEDERAGGKPVHLAVIDLLRREGAAGATAFRALEGFGPSGTLHVPHLVDVQPKLPIVVEWVDAPEKVERVLPLVRALIRHGLVTLEDVEIAFIEPPPVRGIPSGFSVADAMTREVVVVEPGTPLREVVERMMAGGHRSVPVVANGAPVGIVTHGDLLARGGIELRMDLVGRLAPEERAALLDALARSERTAADVMTAPAVTVFEGSPLRDAATLMSRQRLKRLPAVDATGKLAGVLSRVDVLRAASGGGGAPAEGPVPADLDAGAPVAQVMRRDVPTVAADAPLPEVFQAVVATRLNRALVVDEERRVLGVVSDAELLDRLAPPLRRGIFSRMVRRLPFGGAERAAILRHADARMAADLMVDVPRARSDMPLGDAIALVLRGAHKLLAVVDAGGRLVGVLDRADLLRGLLLR